MNRDAGGVNLNKARISKDGTLLIALPGCAGIGPHGHGGQEEYISVASRCQYHCMGAKALKFSGDYIPGNNPTCFSVDHHQVIHFHAGIHLHIALLYLSAQRLVGSQEKLLSCLAARIECPGHKCSSKRAVVKAPTILTGKGNTLGNALVDNIVTYLCKSVYIGLP